MQVTTWKIPQNQMVCAKNHSINMFWKTKESVCPILQNLFIDIINLTINKIIRKLSKGRAHMIHHIGFGPRGRALFFPTLFMERIKKKMRLLVSVKLMVKFCANRNKVDRSNSHLTDWICESVRNGLFTNSTTYLP